ncbi:MAG: foldase [Syntrophomonadaceae bacterium]|nr:foldase [Syntrophomonadaceae bacterium]
MVKKANALKYIIILIGLLTVAATAYWGLSRSQEEIVARVGSEVITKNELYNFMVQQTGQEALDNLVVKKIIELEAENQNIKVTADEIDKEVEDLAKYYGGKDAMTQTLAMYNINLDQVREDVTVNIKLEKLLSQRIKITDEEIQEHFQDHQEAYAVEEQIKVSHILVENEQEAQEIKTLLAEGGNFNDLARERSTDPGSKEQGGDLGMITRGEMGEEFDQVAFALQPGQISDPVKSEYGYHIIKVEEKTEARPGTLEENYEKIKDNLFQQKMELEYPIWLGEQYQKYPVENFLT